jgi:hypothetical protein
LFQQTHEKTKTGYCRPFLKLFVDAIEGSCRPLLLQVWGT